MSREPKTGNMRLENDTKKRLCENVRSVVDTRSMFNDKRIGFDMRANEMITDVDMLGLSMVGIIGRERSCTIVVGGENERRRAADLKLSYTEGQVSPARPRLSRGPFGVLSLDSRCYLCFQQH